MHETRSRFHQELAALEAEIVTIGERAEDMIERAVHALVHHDAAEADRVIADDDEVDRLYLDIERRVLDLFATQAPVASDLRLLSVIMHVNLHLERIGDQAVNVSKMALAAMHLPANDLNRGMYRHVVKLGGDEAALEWGIRMNVVSRQLERVGDNAVDIGEQVAFLLTGEFREFTDASHTGAR